MTTPPSCTAMNSRTNVLGLGLESRIQLTHVALYWGSRHVVYDALVKAGHADLGITINLNPYWYRGSTVSGITASIHALKSWH
jgi:hypothetical protein